MFIWPAICLWERSPFGPITHKLELKQLMIYADACESQRSCLNIRALLTYNGKYHFYVVKDARWVTSDININRRCSVSAVVGARSGATLGISHLRGFERLILMPPGGSANTFKTGRRPPVEATYLLWPRNTSDSHRRSLKMLLGEGCLDSPLARFPVSLFFSCTFQKDSASAAYDCSCCCFTFPILLYNHHSWQLVIIVQSEKFKSSPYGQLSRGFFRVSE